MKKLSIITINLNNKSGLLKTIQSIVAQTFKEFEYIVVDGASTDGSVEVIKKYAQNITKWVSEKDTGIYNAMNKGIELATGEYLLFLNSGDVFVDNDSLSNLNIGGFNEDILYGNMQFLNKDNMRIKTVYPEKLSNKFWVYSCLPHQATFIKKILFAKYGLYNQEYRIAGDFESWLRFIYKHNAVYKHLDHTISVFQGYDGASTSKKMRKIHQQERNRLLKQYFPINIYLLEQARNIKKNIKEYILNNFIKFIIPHDLRKNIRKFLHIKYNIDL